MIDERVNVIEELSKVFVSELERRAQKVKIRKDVVVRKKKIKRAKPLKPLKRALNMNIYKRKAIDPDFVEIPVIIDMKKAMEDYNSIDYQVLMFNKHRSKIVHWHVVD